MTVRLKSVILTLGGNDVGLADILRLFRTELGGFHLLVLRHLNFQSIIVIIESTVQLGAQLI